MSRNDTLSHFMTYGIICMAYYGMHMAYYAGVSAIVLSLFFAIQLAIKCHIYIR